MSKECGCIRKSWMKCTTPGERVRAFSHQLNATVKIEQDGTVWAYGRPLDQDTIDETLDRIDLGLPR